MDNSSLEMQQSMLQAIETISQRAIENLPYDQTIVGTIHSFLGKRNGKTTYKINYNGSTFNAVTLNETDNTYNKNTSVYVFIPQGDFSQEKIIMGRASNLNAESNLDIKTVVLNNFSTLGKNNLNWIKTDTDSVGLYSYHNKTEEIEDSDKIVHRIQQLYSKNSKDNYVKIDNDFLNTYTSDPAASAIMIRADFRTNLSLEQKQQATGRYVLKFTLKFKNSAIDFGETQGEILEEISKIVKANTEFSENEIEFFSYFNQIDELIKNLNEEINEDDFNKKIINSDSQLKIWINEAQAVYETFAKNNPSKNTEIIQTMIENYLTTLNNLQSLDLNSETEEISQKVKYIKQIYDNWFDFKINPESTAVLKLDSNSMIGNPLYFNNWTSQRAIYELDLSNFKEIEDITFYKEGFISNSKLEKEDIFIKDLGFYVLKPLDSISGDYFLKVEAPNTGSILPKAELIDETETEEKEVNFIASFYRKTEDLTYNLKTNYYWFKEDPSITIGETNYSEYGGKGWKLIKHLNTFSTTSSENPSLKNIYKCVAVFNESSESTIVVATIFTVYNLAYGNIVELSSNLGQVFQFRTGSPIITCLINGQEINSLDDKELKFYWSLVPIEGLEIPLYEENEGLESYLNGISYFNLEGKEIKDSVLATKIKYPIANLFFDETLTFRCVVTSLEEDKETIIGSGEIILENQNNATANGYHIEFENDGQVFQYDEYGNSPLTEAKLDYQKILPIRAKFIGPNGLEITGINVQVDWIFNLENSMIVPPDGLIYNSITGKSDLLKNTASCNFNIEKIYNPNAINNQITCHINFNGEDYYKQTSLFFRKIGENGTNGTDITVRIQPQSINPILDTQALTLYTFEDKKDKDEEGKERIKGFLNEKYKKDDKRFLTSVQLTEAEKSGFQVNVYQKGELLSSDKYKSYWNLAGNASETRISKGKNFKLGKFENEKIYHLYWDSTENLSQLYQLQIIKNHVVFSETEIITDEDGNNKTRQINKKEYYGYYPLPIIHFKNEADIAKYANDRLAIDKTFYLKEIMYNADGRNPIYNHNQGLKIINLPDWCNKSNIEIIAKGGWSKEENQPDFIILEKETIFDKENHSIMIYILPNDACSGSKTNNRIEVNIYQEEINNQEIDQKENNDQEIDQKEIKPIITISAPIIFTLNTFGLASLNAWDGNSVTIDEEGGYIMAPQIGAGEKDDNNRFTGIVMGKTEIHTGGSEKEKQIGLFGYKDGLQSIFLDAETGDAIFGLPDVEERDEERDEEGNPKKFYKKTNREAEDNYQEGRIELRPGGTSIIGGWRIGRKSLYYTEKGTLGEKNGPDYVWKDGTIQLDEDNAYAKYHDKDIAHDQGGILLYGGKKPYISIKSEPLKDVDVSEDSDSLLAKDDSLELQLDPNTPTLFTIFRHNGKDKHYNNSTGVQYPKDSRTFLAGINNRGEFIANSITNKTSSQIMVSQDTVETLTDIASKFYFNILPAFDDQNDESNYVGFKMMANNETLGQFFTSLKILSSNKNNISLQDTALNISGGNNNKNNSADSWWGEYYRPLNLYGRTISLYGPSFTPSSQNNLRAQKQTNNNLIIDQSYGQIQIGDISLLKMYKDADGTDPNKLISARDLEVSAGKKIDAEYTEAYLNDIPLSQYSSEQYSKIVLGENIEVYLEENELDNGIDYVKVKDEYQDSWTEFYKISEDKYISKINFNNSYYHNNKNTTYILKENVENNLFKKIKDETYTNFLIEDSLSNLVFSSNNYDDLYYSIGDEFDSSNNIPYWYIQETDIDFDNPYVKINNIQYKKDNNNYYKIYDDNNIEKYILENTFNDMSKFIKNNNIYFQETKITKVNDKDYKKYYKVTEEGQEYFIDLDEQNIHYIRRREINNIKYKSGADLDSIENILINNGFTSGLIGLEDKEPAVVYWTDLMYNQYMFICREILVNPENIGYNDSWEKKASDSSTDHENCYVRVEKNNENAEYYILYTSIDFNNLIKDSNSYLKITGYYNNNNNEFLENNHYYINSSEKENFKEEYIHYNDTWYKKEEDNDNNYYKYSKININEEGPEEQYLNENLLQYYTLKNSYNNKNEIIETDFIIDEETNSFKNYTTDENIKYYKTKWEKWIVNTTIFSIKESFELNEEKKLIEYCLEEDQKNYIKKDEIDQTFVYYQNDSSYNLLNEDSIYKQIIYNNKEYYKTLKEISNADKFVRTGSGEYLSIEKVNFRKINKQNADKKYKLTAKEYFSQIITSTFSNNNNIYWNGLETNINNSQINLDIRNLPLKISTTGQEGSFSLNNLGKIGLSQNGKALGGSYTSNRKYGSISITEPILGLFKINNNGLFITNQLTALTSKQYLELLTSSYINITAKTIGNGDVYSLSNPQILLKAGSTELVLNSSNNKWSGWSENNKNLQSAAFFGVDLGNGQGIYIRPTYKDKVFDGSIFDVNMKFRLDSVSKLLFNTKYKEQESLKAILDLLFDRIQTLKNKDIPEIIKEYLEGNGYATQSYVDTKNTNTREWVNKNYALNNHTHSEYAKSSHTHTVKMTGQIFSNVSTSAPLVRANHTGPYYIETSYPNKGLNNYSK